MSTVSVWTQILYRRGAFVQSPKPQPDSNQTKIYLGRKARKRLEAALVRQQIEQNRRLEVTRDKRERRAERIPMPRPGCIKQRLEVGGAVYVLLHWETGEHVGRFKHESRQAG